MVFIYPVDESVLRTGIVEGTVVICSKDTKVLPFDFVISLPHIYPKEIIRELHQDVFTTLFFIQLLKGVILETL